MFLIEIIYPKMRRPDVQLLPPAELRRGQFRLRLPFPLLQEPRIIYLFKQAVIASAVGGGVESHLPRLLEIARCPECLASLNRIGIERIAVQHNQVCRFSAVFWNFGAVGIQGEMRAFTMRLHEVTHEQPADFAAAIQHDVGNHVKS